MSPLRADIKTIQKEIGELSELAKDIQTHPPLLSVEDKAQTISSGSVQKNSMLIVCMNGDYGDVHLYEDLDEISIAISRTPKNERFLGLIPYEFPYGLNVVLEHSPLNGESELHWWMRVFTRQEEEIYQEEIHCTSILYVQALVSRFINKMEDEVLQMRALGYIKVWPWRFDRIWENDGVQQQISISRKMSHLDTDRDTMIGVYVRHDSDKMTKSKVKSLNSIVEMALSFERVLINTSHGLEVLESMTPALRDAVIQNPSNSELNIEEQRYIGIPYI